MPVVGQILSGSKYTGNTNEGKAMEVKVSTTPNTLDFNVKKFPTKYKNANTSGKLDPVDMTIPNPVLKHGSSLNGKSFKNHYTNNDRALQFDIDDDQTLRLYNDVVGYLRYRLDWKFLHYEGSRHYYNEARTSSIEGNSGAAANRIVFNDLLIESIDSDTVQTIVTQISSNVLAREVKYTTRYHSRFTYGYEFDCSKTKGLTYDNSTKTFEVDGLQVFKLYDKAQFKVEDKSGVVQFFTSDLNISLADKGTKVIAVYFNINTQAQSLIKNLLDVDNLESWSSILYVGTATAPDLDLTTLDTATLDYQNELEADGISVSIENWSPINRDPFYVAPSNGLVAIGSLVNHHLVIPFNATKFGVDLSTIRVQYTNDKTGASSMWLTPADFYMSSRLITTVATSNASNPDYDEDNYDGIFYIKMAGVSSASNLMYTHSHMSIMYDDGDGNSETFTDIHTVKDLDDIKIDEFSLYKSALTKVDPAREPEMREIYEWRNSRYLEIINTKERSTYDYGLNTKGSQRPYTNDYVNPILKTAVEGESNIFKSFKIEFVGGKELSTFEFETREAGLGSFQIGSTSKAYIPRSTFRYYNDSKTEGVNDTVGVTDYQENIDLKLTVGDGYFKRVRKVYGKKTLEKVMDESIKEELILPQNMRATLSDDNKTITLTRDVTSTDGKMHTPIEVITFHPPTASIMYNDTYSEPTDINVISDKIPTYDDDFVKVTPEHVELKYTLDEKYVDNSGNIHYIITKIFDNDTKESLLDAYTTDTSHVEIDPLGTFYSTAMSYDGFIYRTQANTSYLDDNVLWIGVNNTNGGNDGTLRTVIKPNLSGLDGATILSASLILNPKSVHVSPDFGSSNMFHGIQGMRVTRPYNDHLSWNKYLTRTNWSTPGVLSPLDQMDVDSMVDTADYQLETFFGNSDTNYVDWDADGNDDPEEDVERSFEFNSSGIAWLQGIIDGNITTGTDSMILYDAKMEIYHNYNSAIRGYLKFDSSTSGGDNQIQLAIEYNRVEFGDQDDLKGQNVATIDPAEWFLSDTSSDGFSWSDIIVSYKIRVNGTGFTPGTDHVQWRFYDGSTWLGWSNNDLLGYYTSRNINSDEHANGVTTDAWIYPTYLFNWGYLNSSMDTYKFQFRVLHGDGTTYTGPALWVDFDKSNPTSPTMHFKDDVGGNTLTDGEWTNINTPAVYFVSTDADSGVHGYSLCGIPPGGESQRVPDMDTIIDDGGHWTTNEYFDTGADEVPEGIVP